jgi:hypothetical protein
MPCCTLRLLDLSEDFAMPKKKTKKQKAVKAVEKAVKKAVHKGVPESVVEHAVVKAIAKNTDPKNAKAEPAKKKSRPV